MINCLIQPTRFCTETRAWLVADSFEPKTHWDNNILMRVKCRFLVRFNSRLVIVYWSGLTMQIAKENMFYAKMLWGAQKSWSVLNSTSKLNHGPWLDEPIHYRSDFQARQSNTPQNIFFLVLEKKSTMLCSGISYFILLNFFLLPLWQIFKTYDGIHIPFRLPVQF